MVVHSLRKALAALALCAGLAVVAAVPVIASTQADTVAAETFTPPY